MAISRSGLWAIGGVLLLSAAVLAWALQSDPSTAWVPASGPARVTHRPIPAARPTTPRPAARTRTTVEELATRRPSVDEYNPLLQGNVFQPRVIQREVRASSPPAHPAATARRRPASENRAASSPVSTDSWHDWKYNGIAQLDQQTYALMDLANKKESRFVKVGDHLEDAIVERVGENEVALREAGGSVVHVQRVDAMAELMRSVRTPAPAARLAAPPTSGSTPATAAPGSGSVIINPTGQGLPQAAPSAPAIQDDGSQGGRRGRGRRFRQSDGAGGFGDQ